MKTSLLAFVALLLLSTTAFAAAEGEGLPWGNFITRSINVAIFVGIIWYAAGSMIKKFLAGRKQTIIFELEEAERIRNEAEAHLFSMEKRIVNVEVECTKLLEDGRKQAEKIKDGIIAEAQKQAQELLETAQKNIGQQERTAAITIREHLAKEIVEQMQKQLSGGIDIAKQQDLIDKSLLKVVLQ